MSAATAKPTLPASAQSVLGWKNFLAALVIALAVLAAYSNSFHGPFIVDDLSSIVDNSTIQHGGRAALTPLVGGETAAGRPLVNLSLALNYEAGGLAVTGYHAVNLAIHLFAGLVLFGLVRRTLELPSLRRDFGPAALPLALGVALLWALHPLQTASVTYVVQRAEALAGLFYLLTLYGFVRGCEAASKLWLMLAVLACLLGVFCKEVSVTAPIMVLLYDRTFVAGTFRAAVQGRRKFYAALAATWLPLGWQVWNAGTRGGSAGFGLGTGPLDYALAQGPVIANYLRLWIWPHPLAQDYGPMPVSTGMEAWPAAAMIAALAVATLWALWRRPAFGLLGAWWFLTLAPSSSFLPIVTDVAAEHRLYLPVAALAAITVVTLFRWTGRGGLAVVAALAVALALLTFQRNEDYRTTLRLWQENTANQPDVARVRESYGLSLTAAGRLPEAAEELRQALRLQPNYPDCENDLANVLVLLGQNAEAIPHFAQAATGLPRAVRASAYFSMGNALRALGQLQRALDAYQCATALRPDFAEAYNNQGAILEMSGQFASAIPLFQAAARIDPHYAVGELNLANTYVESHQPDAALPHYAKVIAEDPQNGAAHAHFANALADLSRWDDAEKQYALAESIQPNQAEVHFNRGICLMKLGRTGAATVEFENALRLNPNQPQAQAALEQMRATPANTSGAQPPTP